MLEGFASHFGADFYDQPRNRGVITLERKPQIIADQYSGIVPFMANEEISWSVAQK